MHPVDAQDRRLAQLLILLRSNDVVEVLSQPGDDKGEQIRELVLVGEEGEFESGREANEEIFALVNDLRSVEALGSLKKSLNVLFGDGESTGGIDLAQEKHHTIARKRRKGDVDAATVTRGAEGVREEAGPLAENRVITIEELAFSLA